MKITARNAKQLLLWGSIAIALALLIELLNQSFIAHPAIIILTAVLLAGGVIAFLISIVWYLMHPMKKKS